MVETKEVLECMRKVSRDVEGEYSMIFKLDDILESRVDTEEIDTVFLDLMADMDTHLQPNTSELSRLVSSLCKDYEDLLLSYEESREESRIMQDQIVDLEATIAGQSQEIEQMYASKARR